MIDKTILDEIIIGRVEPHIYAFTTNTIPNYLKVGDTYRPVSVRLKETQNLEKYMHTKFFRFMLGIKKIAQVLTSNIYSFVPLF